MENRKLSQTCDTDFGDRRRPDAVEQFAASLAYGVRNPLTVIKGYLQLYQCNPAHCTQESLQLMLREAEAIETVTVSLIAVVRQLAAEKSLQELQLFYRLLTPAVMPHSAALSHSGRSPLCSANGEAVDEARGISLERLKKLKRHQARMPAPSDGSETAAKEAGWQREEPCHRE